MTDNRFLEISVSGQVCALPLLSVREVISVPDITALPNMPAFFEGMMNLRGKILGVVDLRKRIFGKKPAANADAREVVVVVETERGEMGVIVDAVNRVLNLNEGEVVAAPVRESDPVAKYVEGVIKKSDELVLILNMHRLLEIGPAGGTARVAA
ncbi:MAG: chemotaxis protein CheW [Bdellovibrionota bacterium]